jgi:hypothetical protein
MCVLDQGRSARCLFQFGVGCDGDVVRQECELLFVGSAVVRVCSRSVWCDQKWGFVVLMRAWCGAVHELARLRVVQGRASSVSHTKICGCDGVWGLFKVSRGGRVVADVHEPLVEVKSANVVEA